VRLQQVVVVLLQSSLRVLRLEPVVQLCCLLLLPAQLLLQAQLQAVS